MKTKLLIPIILSLFLIPLVSANMAIPILATFQMLSFFLLIPIIFIEAGIMYLVLRKFKIKFGYSILALITANVVSTLFGAAFAAILLTNNLANAIILAFIFTVLIEFPVIYLFLKKKIEKPAKYSFYISLITNIASYIFVSIILSFMT